MNLSESIATLERHKRPLPIDFVKPQFSEIEVALKVFLAYGPTREDFIRTLSFLPLSAEMLRDILRHLVWDMAYHARAPEPKPKE